jgi:hypothetical protein
MGVSLWLLSSHCAQQGVDSPLASQPGPSQHQWEAGKMPKARKPGQGSVKFHPRFVQAQGCTVTQLLLDRIELVLRSSHKL